MFVAKDLRPMLATLPSSPPSLKDPAYVYEPKVDGIRAIVEVLPGTPPSVRFWSRNGNEKTAQFPDIVEAIAAWLKKIAAPVVLDGEIVALDEEMRPASFQRLQHRIHVTVPGFNSKKQILPPNEQPAAFVAFDLLRDGDDDLRGQSLTARRKRLEALFKKHKAPSSDLVRLTVQSAGNGEALMQQAHDEQWEGVMVKLARSPYRTAKRSPEWVKYKLNKQDEFVVVGWTSPGGTRTHFGSLILGAAHEGGSKGGLRYAGEVGTGFNAAELERVMKLLRKIETPTCPLDPKPKLLSAKGTPHWVRPLLVAQVRYTEITDDGRLRHPAYLGLRDDKRAEDVAVPKGSSRSKGSKGLVPEAVSTVLRIPTSPEIDAIVDQLNEFERTRKNGKLKLPDGDTLDITNPHKIFWPAIKKTKGDLIRFYAKISPFILPVINNRPLVMKRLPNGVDGPSFYQHRGPEQPPPGVRVATLDNDDVPNRLIGGSLKTLLYMAQLASISMDPWFSTMDDLDSADQVAIDLDPQPGATFDQILDCAEWVEEELDRVKVQGFPKTSGSEGLHVYIPLPKGTPYEAGMLFCQIIATLIAAKHPKVATVERMVRRRKDGTIYVDYLQNIQGKTLACAYSARGSSFAGVSTPLTWKEVRQRPQPQDFTIDTIHARLKKTGDLWEATRKHRGTDLLAAIERLRESSGIP
jgi:bifunctional non-homologous end joining protein LigD